jgi:succinate dehydrogenase / fumarate reductase, cytochrome b subunit
LTKIAKIRQIFAYTAFKGKFMLNPPQKPSDAWKWFDPRGREPGSWAFILNRLSALGLTFYLYLHLVVLGKLAQGPEAFDSYIAAAKTPAIIIGELFVIFGGFYHGLNGLRIALNSFGIAVPYQRQLFYGIFLITIVISVIFGIRMFTV